MWILLAVAAVFIGGVSAGFPSGQQDPEANGFLDHVQRVNSAE